MRRSYELDEETAHKLDCIAIAHGIKKADVIRIVINLYYDPEPSVCEQIRRRVNDAVRTFRDLPRF